MARKVPDEELEMMVGDVYSKLTITAYKGRKNINGLNRPIFDCLCECGKTVTLKLNVLKTGNTTSCGCYGLDVKRAMHITHDMSKTPEYKVWAAMKKRCLNPNCVDYETYGNLGIKVCQEWIDSFEAFYSDMGQRPAKNFTLERRDPYDDYYSENCCWTDNASLQAFNQKKRKTNTSGRTGVDKKHNKYQATICVNYETIYLGLYNTFEEACSAREAAELKYFGFTKE